jgi:hypothetical protein
MEERDKKLRTGLTVLAFAIGIIGLILSIRIMSGYEDVVGTAITLSIVLMVLAGGVALLFGIYQLLSNIKKNMPLLAAIIGFVVLGFVCYSLASDSTVGYQDDITATTSKLSGAGIIFMYVLILGAVGAALIGEVTRIFK